MKSNRDRFFLAAYFLATQCFAQKIQSIEWLSPSAQPIGLNELVGSDIQSKEFSSTIKVLKATEDYQDLEYRFDSGKLILSARKKVFVRTITWNFPKDLPSYVKSDLETHLDMAEDDILPEDLKDRIARLSARVKTRGYQDYDIRESVDGDDQNKTLILDFPSSGRPRETYTVVDFKNVEDKDLLKILSKKITSLESLDAPSWKQSESQYIASIPFVKDDIELEEFRVTLRKQMRAKGYLNFELDIAAVNGALTVSTRNLRQFEFQFDGQVFYFENELRNNLMENLSDRNFDVEEAKYLIKDSYLKKGYRDIMVESRLESMGNKYKVFFNITEGPQYFFRGVDFRNVREEYLPLLKEAERDWLEPFKSPFRNTYFDEDGLKSTLGVLIDGIRARGFLDVEVADYDFALKPGSRFAQLKTSLRLGPRYKYSSFEIKDDDGVLEDVEDIKKPPKAGAFFDGIRLQSYLREIKKKYEDQGYIYSEVDTSSQKILEKNQLLNTVAASIRVRRGPKVFLRNLQIKGNSRTKKKVILREMDEDALEYGGKISPQNIREFESRLLGTGLFSTVDLKPIGTNVEFRGSQTFIDYDLILKERPGGSIEFGPGFRTDLGIVGFGEFSYRNIGGWNRGIFTKLQVSHKLKNYQFLEQDYSASFVEPYPFDFRSRLRFDVRYRLDDDIQYDGETPIKGFNLEETSTSAKLEKRFSEHVSTVATLYQYSLPRIFDIITTSSKTTQKYRLGGNGIEILIDYRDNIFNTLEGWFINEQFEYYSPYLASNRKVNFITSKTRGNIYFHLGKESVIAISLGYDHLWGLTDDAIIPENKRLTLGGRSSIRSLPENFLRFDEAGVAEERAMLGRLEYRMPLFAGWGLASFYEMGEIDVLKDKIGQGERSTGLRHGAGFGVRYKTPVGPLAVDWAYNFNARANEDDYQVSLTIGAF